MPDSTIIFYLPVVLCLTPLSFSITCSPMPDSTINVCATFLMYLNLSVCSSTPPNLENHGRLHTQHGNMVEGYLPPGNNYSKVLRINNLRACVCVCGGGGGGR